MSQSPRIISLIASATEIVAALGFEKQLVGRSHECDFPPSVLSLPACSEAKLDVNASSREIDERVKSILKNAISVYRVFEDLLDELQPSVVITQTQCEVCAVSLKDVTEAVCKMTSSHPEIIACEPMDLKDVWKDIHKVAKALNAVDRANELILSLQTRLNEISEKTSSLKNLPTVASIEWIDPLMSAGNWVPELVTIAGGNNMFGIAGEHSPWMSWDALLAANPDFIVIMPCGFDIARTKEELLPLITHPQWSQLKAVQTNHVLLTDGNQYFNRPGPRLIESAEILAEILHPLLFHFGHEGTGWERLECITE
ncbi:ABC transporter, substrate-binding protein (cluster 8, B12/iron complex) [hydrothermal vent metagenome]|uniref:ABC transporter, substrate-binding protein (Cluster 8, B12/iron complex) n=1 Tax=hydrothermal vent metagenome TaxID=652676 RepID=A0A3B1DI67_9ZZZZ